MQGAFSFFYNSSANVFVGLDKAYFLNLDKPQHPQIYSSIELESGGSYSKDFLGIQNGHAYFSIGYNGTEIIDVRNIESPEKLGITNEYGILTKIYFRNELCLTNTGIFKTENPLNPIILKEFNKPVGEIIVSGNILFYSYISADELPVYFVELENEFNQVPIPTKSHPFRGCQRLSITQNHLAANTDEGIGFIDISKPLSELSVESFYKCQTASPGVFIEGNTGYSMSMAPFSTLTFYNFTDLYSPKIVSRVVFEKGHQWFIAGTNDKYILLCIFGGSSAQGKKSLLILENNQTAAPTIVGEIETELSSNFSLHKDTIYLSEKNGIKIYAIAEQGASRGGLGSDQANCK